jgi:colicin import membrane protein
MAFGAAENSSFLMDQKWSRMIGLSAGVHLAAFFLIMFLANTGPSIRPYRGISYEVTLVEMPGGGVPKASGGPAAVETKAEKAVPKETKAPQRVEEVKRQEKPLVVAKKTVEKATPTPEKPKVSPMDQINKAISNIEKKVKSDNVDHLNTAISRLQTKAQSGAKPGGGGGAEGGGQGVGGGPMALYQMEVEAKIKSNWSYPVNMDRQKLEAVVILTVRQDGKIMKTRLEKRSASTMFDDSVLKAIERSNPLPPFPESYRKSNDELEITFNLKDLEGL